MDNKVINTILIFWILLIVMFVANNNPNYQHLWDLGYYCSFYTIVFIAFYFIWTLFPNVLTRSLLITMGTYYLYHLSIQTIEVFNEPLKQILYRGKYINYILASAMGIGLLVLPIIDKIKNRTR